MCSGFRRSTQVIAWTRHAPVRTWYQCTSLTLRVSRRLALPFCEGLPIAFCASRDSFRSKKPSVLHMRSSFQRYECPSFQISSFFHQHASALNMNADAVAIVDEVLIVFAVCFSFIQGEFACSTTDSRSRPEGPVPSSPFQTLCLSTIRLIESHSERNDSRGLKHVQQSTRPIFSMCD